MANRSPLCGETNRAWCPTPGPSGTNDAADPDAAVTVPKTPQPLGAGSSGQHGGEDGGLQRILKKVDDMINAGRASGYTYAADNLEHWRLKKAGTIKMPAEAFKGQPFISEWLKKKVWWEFVKGTEKRLKSGELVPGGTVDMYWVDSLYAPEGHQLYYALGGFTIRSDVTVRAVELPDGQGLVFEFDRWVCRVSDDYNWDKLKSTVIPLFGSVRDEELLLLEEHGYGQSYKVESEPWRVEDKKVLQAFSVTGY